MTAREIADKYVQPARGFGEAWEPYLERRDHIRHALADDIEAAITEALEKAAECCDEQAKASQREMRQIYMCQALSDTAKEEEVSRHRPVLATAKLLADQIRRLIGAVAKAGAA